MERNIIFKLEKETKNTYKFEEKPEPGQPAIIGSLYVQKWVFEQKPEEVSVTLKHGMPVMEGAASSSESI